MRHLFRISLAHFSQHRLRTALTLIGISAGVVAVVATTILSDSLLHSFDNLVSATAGDAELHVANGAVGVPEELVEELRNVGGVAAVSGVVEGFVPLLATPGKLLAVFGMDVLADDSWRRHISRDSIELPDEMAFVSNDDSVVLTTGYAAKQGLGIGSTLEVIGPAGHKMLVVRGLVEHKGLDKLFEGRVAVMDLPASQLFLSKLGKLDRIDLYLDEGANIDGVKTSVEMMLTGRGRVRDRAAHGKRALDLLLTVRVMLGQAVVMSLIVGFLIIYHTMSVSIVLRHREIALLRSLGASRALILGWVSFEALALGLVASSFGIIAAVGLGRFAANMFGPLTDSWIRLSLASPGLSWATAVAAVAMGAGTSLAATLWAGARVLRHVIQPDRNLTEVSASSRARLRRVLAIGAAASGLATVLMVFAPHLESFFPIMGYTAVVLVLVYVAFGLASALPSLWIGRAGVAAAKQRPGIGLLFASATLLRSPTAPAAVVSAIVVALSWTVGNAAYMASVRTTWLGWVDREYPPGKILVTAEGGLTGLTPPAFAKEVVNEIRRMPGVTWVEGLRQLGSEYAGRPIILQARDEPKDGFRLADGRWAEISGRFLTGEGVLMDDNLAYVTRTRVGDVATLQTNDGARDFRVLGLLNEDLEGGDLGSIVLARGVYETLWRDSTVNRVRVTIGEGSDEARVASEINERFTASHGLQAATWETSRASLAEMIDAAFAATYALIFVGFVVSFIAIVNFLLAMLVERRMWYQRLHALSASSAQIRGTILTEGGIMGVVGSLLGVCAAAVASCYAVFRSIPMVNGWHFDYAFPLVPVVTGVVGTVFLAVAAAGFPARLATRSHYLLESIEK